MNLDKVNTRQIGGLVLEVLMFVFVFASSLSQVSLNDCKSPGELTIHALPVEQIVFRDSDSSSESLLELISKIKTADSEFPAIDLGLAGLEFENTEAFSINQSLYNTFYSHTTANAP